VILPGVHQPSFLWEVVVTQETWAAVRDAPPEDVTEATYAPLRRAAKPPT
jgi:hypothetical protein